MDIYIKPKKKAVLTGRKAVYISDIGEVYASGGKAGDIGSMIILTLEGNKEETRLISVMDVIKAVSAKYPDASVSNVGEMDTVLEYQPKAKKTANSLTALKILCAFIILFAGSATAIMSFHSDAQMSQIFRNYYYIFFREQVDMPNIVAIPYSIGLALGIIIFFNHFSKIYLTKDPTPIEVQMTTYEKETNDCIIDNLGRANEKKSGGG